MCTVEECNTIQYNSLNRVHVYLTAQIQLCEVHSTDDDDLSTGRSSSSRPSLVVVKMLSPDATDKAR